METYCQQQHPINRNLKLDTLLCADQQVILKTSVHKLQRSAYNLRKAAKDFNMKISTDKD
jgi:hypothetical protein